MSEPPSKRLRIPSVNHNGLMNQAEDPQPMADEKRLAEPEPVAAAEQPVAPVPAPAEIQEDVPGPESDDEDMKKFDANEHTIWIDDDEEDYEKEKNEKLKQNFFLPHSDHTYDPPHKVKHPRGPPFPVLGNLDENGDEVPTEQSNEVEVEVENETMPEVNGDEMGEREEQGNEEMIEPVAHRSFEDLQAELANVNRQWEADLRRDRAKIRSQRDMLIARYKETDNQRLINDELRQTIEFLRKELAKTKGLVSADVAAAAEEIQDLKNQLDTALESNALLRHQLGLTLEPVQIDESVVQNLRADLDASHRESEDLRKKLEAANRSVQANDSETPRDAEQRVATATAEAAKIVAAAKAKAAEIEATATAKAVEVVAAATVEPEQLMDTALLEAEEEVATARRENRAEAQQRRCKKELKNLQTDLNREPRSRKRPRN
ncbi:hypothetical protein CAEBREN_17930 [Caenorhabditis brenneri]|uniref:Uncharacterized protein n=1 Tax=Caenorhabditis brenneri TaxID=135651 RepID=G0NY98_CAEBE|nr:hypothetical protein CAEBREN_17930 [Caenorhabditis brenneri]